MISVLESDCIEFCPSVYHICIYICIYIDILN